MVPSSFAEANAVLDRPEGMSDEECTVLSVLQTVTADGHPVVVSCWKLTKEELEQVQQTGRIWLLVYGRSMPPVSLTGAVPFARG